MVLLGLSGQILNAQDLAATTDLTIDPDKLAERSFKSKYRTGVILQVAGGVAGAVGIVMVISGSVQSAGETADILFGSYDASKAEAAADKAYVGGFICFVGATMMLIGWRIRRKATGSPTRCMHEWPGTK